MFHMWMDGWMDAHREGLGLGLGVRATRGRSGCTGLTSGEVVFVYFIYISESYICEDFTLTSILFSILWYSLTRTLTTISIHQSLITTYSRGDVDVCPNLTSVHTLPSKLRSSP